MYSVEALTSKSKNTYWRYALWLALLTILYNFAEGIVSIYFGDQDETLTLFGFGLDSFIEVLSGAGILVMVLRIRQNGLLPRSQFEQTALRITGIAFYLLAVGLGVISLYNLFIGHRPTATLSGVVISLISIALMWALVLGKRKVGRVLDSPPILADANCSMVCIYMSAVLLAASLTYQLTGLGFIDSLGALGLIYFSAREGREAFEKAAGMEDTCCDDMPKINA